MVEAFVHGTAAAAGREPDATFRAASCAKFVKHDPRVCLAGVGALRVPQRPPAGGESGRGVEVAGGGHRGGRRQLIPDDAQPFTVQSGKSRATLRAMPASATESTTGSTALYA